MDVYIDYKAINKLPMKNILEVLEYEIVDRGGVLYGKLTRPPYPNEKSIFRIVECTDGLQRCYPFTDDPKGYTNMGLIENFLSKNNVSYTANQFIFKHKEKLGYSYKDKLPENSFSKVTMADLQKYKSMDFQNIILSMSNLGFNFGIDKSKTSTRYPVLKGCYPDGAERELVLKQNKDGNWIAWDRTNNAKLYDCIGLLKEYFPTDKLYQIKEKLELLSNSVGKSSSPQFNGKEKKEEEKALTFLLNGVNHRYIAVRGLDHGLIQKHPGLNTVLKKEKYIIGENTYSNQVYIFRNIINKEQCGYLRRNISLDGSNLKGFNGTKDGLFFNDYEKGEKSTVLFGESFENVFSYYQMNEAAFKNAGQIIFVSTSGNPKQEQLDQFKYLVEKDIKLQKLYILGDNDVSGQMQNTKALQSLTGGVIDKISASKKINQITVKCYDPSLEKKIADFLPGVDCKIGEDDNLKKQLIITLPYDTESLYKTNEFFIDHFLDNRKYILQKSEKNDFNEDLVIKFGVQQYIDDSRKFKTGENDLLQGAKADYMVTPQEYNLDPNKVSEDILDKKLTAINAIELYKKSKPGVNVSVPKQIRNEIKKVSGGKLKTNKDIKHEITKSKTKVRAKKL